MKRIVIRIDNLALRGFRHADRHAVAAGLQAELGRLLAASVGQARLATLGAVPRLSVAPVRVGLGGTPREVGLAAARAIGGAIER
jgi:hypothetical protein